MSPIFVEEEKFERSEMFFVVVIMSGHIFIYRYLSISKSYLSEYIHTVNLFLYFRFRTEAQSNDDLFEVLNRKLFYDGKNILTTLHVNKHLKKVSTDSVILNPSPSESILLSDHNNMLNTVKSQSIDQKLAEQQPVDKPSDYDAKEKKENETLGQARNLIIQAQLLEEDARRKRVEAEKIYPGINDETKRPRGRPKKDAPVSPLLNTTEGSTSNEKISS